jgi:hypothetical protein
VRDVNRWNLLIACVILLVVVISIRAHALVSLSFSHPIDVAIVADPLSDPKTLDIYDAYLTENGIPHAVLSTRDFLLLDSPAAVRSFPVLVFPDRADRELPPQVRDAAEAFTEDGGRTIVISDAGTVQQDGAYLRTPIFQSLLGVAYAQYDAKRATAYVNGKLRFLSPQSLAAWGIPYGKYDSDLQLTTYGYGTESFPLPSARAVSTDTSVEAVTVDNGVAISRRSVGRGQAIFVGLPLGYLKGRSDGFMMQAVFGSLVREAQLPHLVPAPDGIGRIIFDFHIDSRIESRGIPNLVARHLLRPDIPLEFDVTAGPDRDRAGDGLGLDACGRGRPLVQTLMRYGRIGSHGGWAHNEFAHDVEAGRLSESQIRDLIAKNNNCLSSITGYPILSFAAPAGVHPQPEMSDALASLGMNSYYYTGDSGSSAERPVYNGRFVDPGVIAFPIMPLRDYASVGEFSRHHVAAKDVDHWMQDTLAFTMQQRNIHLFYSHSYDFLDAKYVPAFQHWEDTVSKAIQHRSLSAGDMASSATFFKRFIQTTASFSRDSSGLRVTLDNPQGLSDVAFAVPREDRPNEQIDQLRSAGEDQFFRYYFIRSDDRHIEVTFAVP